MHRNYLFDLDQTLLDFHASEKIALGKVLTENGLSFSDDIYNSFKSCNKSLWGELEKGEITRTELFIKRFSYIFSLCTGDATGLDPLKVNSDFIVTMSKNGVLMDGALELVGKIKNEIEDSRIYIVSNGATINAKGRIASTGLDKYIDGLFVSEDMGVNKPAPEYFDLVLQAIGLFIPSATLWLVALGNGKGFCRCTDVDGSTWYVVSSFTHFLYAYKYSFMCCLFLSE